MAMSEGIFYIVYGESHYFREVKRSVESLRKHCDLPIAIFTDKNFQIDGCMSFLIETDIEYRSQPKSTDRFRLKLELLKELPFKRTVYVDTDTLFLDDPSKLFENNYDIAKQKYRLKEIYNSKERDIPITAPSLSLYFQKT